MAARKKLGDGSAIAPAPKPRNKRSTPLPRDLRREALEEMNPSDLSIVDQVWLATRWDNLGATIGGFLLGGLVPLAAYAEAHYVVDKVRWWWDPHSILVAGCLAFSVYTVYFWGLKAFEDVKVKSVGFMLAIEGIMVFSPLKWLAITCLVYLIVINGIATGVGMSLDRWRKVKGNRKKAF